MAPVRSRVPAQVIRREVPRRITSPADRKNKT